MALTRTSPRHVPPSGRVTLRTLAETVRNTQRGRVDWVGQLTLSTSVSNTSFDDIRVHPNSVIQLSPSTANAAADVASVFIQDADYASHSFTVRHPIRTTTDRVFRYIVLG